MTIDTEGLSFYIYFVFPFRSVFEIFFSNLGRRKRSCGYSV